MSTAAIDSPRSGPASERLYERALAWVPTGTHSNSRLREPHPLYLRAAGGGTVVDVDGHERVDFTMGNGAVILGHGHPAVQDAVRGAVERGLTTGYEVEDAVAVAELLAAIVPGFRAVRYANTGTEAVMHALNLARSATGRDRVAKPEASYHGWSDQMWVSTWPPIDRAGEPAAPASVPGSGGLSAEAARTLVLPFNDAEAAERLIDEHADELAAVILEPVMVDIGFIPANPEYLEAVRRACARHGIVFILDELLTGFRIAPGGAAERYGIVADLRIFGKGIANGYPLAVVEGNRELMALSDPAAGGDVGWVGTYNGHAISMAAARASLAELATGEPWRRLDALTARLRDGLHEVAAEAGVPLHLMAGGGHFQPYFTAEPPVDYRSAATSDATLYRRLVQAADAAGLIIADKPLGHSALCAAHSDEQVDRLIAAASLALSG